MLRMMLLLFCLVAVAVGARAEAPRYVFINKAPGIEWRQESPECFTRAGFEEIASAIPTPEGAGIRVGVAFMFSILEGDVDTLAASLEALLKASEESGAPVLVTLDGQQWWGGRPELWNWWDPEKPGYDPANAANVEWTDWDASAAVKVGWRNWGSQIRVTPAPNLSSPVFIEANLERLARLVPVIAKWYEALPAEKRFLLGGVKLGNEAGTGYNAFYYPGGNEYLEQWPEDPSHDPQYGLDTAKGLAGGVAQIGYASVKTAGIKDSGDITREDLAKVTQQYLAALARKTHECGIPQSLIFVHQGGNYPPWGTHIPFSGAFNTWSTPSWSFYGLDPSQIDELQSQMADAGRTRWAAAEWWWGAGDEAGWYDHFARTLGFLDCRFIAVYNWNCGFKFKEQPAGRAALVRLVAESVKDE